jgi:hypothetical protein
MPQVRIASFVGTIMAGKKNYWTQLCLDRLRRQAMRRVICIHCKQDRAHVGRGLCKACYLNPEVKELYPKLKLKNGRPRKTQEDPGPTEDELERTIQEQMRCLPEWWERSGRTGAP